MVQTKVRRERRQEEEQQGNREWPLGRGSIIIYRQDCVPGRVSMPARPHASTLEVSASRVGHACEKKEGYCDGIHPACLPCVGLDSLLSSFPLLLIHSSVFVLLVQAAPSIILPCFIFFAWTSWPIGAYPADSILSTCYKSSQVRDLRSALGRGDAVRLCPDLSCV